MRGEFVDLDGVRLYCFAFGRRGAGNPIVLVHGAFYSSHVWRDTLPRLPEGHRVLAFDLLGHGRSDPAGGQSLSAAAHATRLHSLLQTMGVTSAVVLGHDFGASIALHLASRHPALVSHLMLINPISPRPFSPFAIGPVGRLTRLGLLAPLWKRLPPQWLASALHGSLLPGYSDRYSGEHSLDVHLYPFQSRAGRDSACQQLRDLVRTANRDSNDLNPPTCPVSLITGAKDQFASESQIRHLLEFLKSGQTTVVAHHILQGVSHLAPEESPDHVGALTGGLLEQQPLPLP